MTVRPDFPLHSETTVPGLAFKAMQMVMLHEAKERGLTVVENGETRLSIQTEHGLFGFEDAGDGIAVAIHSARPEWLYMLKERLMERVSHALPDAVRGLRWSGTDQAGSLPPNFHFATIQSVFPVGTAFLRVRASLPDLSSFGDAAIHFRLVLPPDGIDEVEWPTIAENGSTIWPTGEKTLHRPVYTVRAIDRTAGTFDFDVFLHDGGRVTDWAKTVEPETRIGIMGPVGGGIPVTRRMLIYADETAFPAVARILESLPYDAHGHVTLLARDGAYCTYPLTAPQGVSVTWYGHDDAVNLADLALTTRANFQDHFLWFACEKSDVLRVRAAYKESQSDPAKAYISAYWSQT